jgi:hypothetical protein
MALKYLPDRFRQDRNIVMAAVSQDGKAIEYAPEAFLMDKELFLQALRTDAGIIRLLPAGLQADRDIFMTAIKTAHAEAGRWDKTLVKEDILQFADKSILSDPEFAEEIVALSGSSIKYFSDDIRNTKAIGLKAVRNDWRTLEHLSKELRGDRDIVLLAMQQDIRALKFATKDLRADPVVILAGARKSERAMEYAAGMLPCDSMFRHKVTLFRAWDKATAAVSGIIPYETVAAFRNKLGWATPAPV